MTVIKLYGKVGYVSVGLVIDELDSCILSKAGNKICTSYDDVGSTTMIPVRRVARKSRRSVQLDLKGS
jgi:hypothetical protein